MWQVNYYSDPGEIRLDIWNNLEGGRGTYFKQIKPNDVHHVKTTLNSSQDKYFILGGPRRDREIKRSQVDECLDQIKVWHDNKERGIWKPGKRIFSGGPS